VSDKIAWNAVMINEKRSRRLRRYEIQDIKIVINLFVSVVIHLFHISSV